MFFLLVGALFRRPIPARYEAYINAAGIRHPVDLTAGLAEGLGLADVGLDIVQGGLSGPVGTATVIKEASDAGLRSLVVLVAYITISMFDVS